MTGVAPRCDLRLFLDAANPSDWETWLPTGVFHGVTTNPLLLERAGQVCSVDNLARLARRARELGAKEIQLQTWGPDVAALVETGRRLADLGAADLKIVVKVPLTRVGLSAARRLADAETPVTLTAVYEPAQVVMAAGFGAAYAAPYLGRMCDAGRDGVADIVRMHEILSRTGSATRLLTASLRTADQVVDLASRGLDTFTFGPQVAEQLLASEMTTRAAADFQRAAEAMGDDR